jgi:hypothetical protein
MAHPNNPVQVYKVNRADARSASGIRQSEQRTPSTYPERVFGDLPAARSERVQDGRSDSRV